MYRNVLSRPVLALGLALVTLPAFAATPVAAQEAAAAAAPAPVNPELATFAKAFISVGLVRDDFNAQLAMPKNKTVEHQIEIRKLMKEKIEETIRAAGLTLDGYKQLEYTVTVDPASRAEFDRLLVEIARAG
jgi:hypothetical protein